MPPMALPTNRNVAMRAGALLIGAGLTAFPWPAAAHEAAPLQPIMSLAAAAARTDSLGAFLSAIKSQDAMGADENLQDAILLPPHVTTAYERPHGYGTFRQIMVAPGDPFFPRWQSAANERLAAENGGPARIRHPLSAADPGQAVVICEAGCKSSVDEIVYAAPRTPAAHEPGETSPETTSSVVLAAVASRPTHNGAFECLAGCYGEAEPPARSSFAGRLAQAFAASYAWRSNPGNVRAAGSGAASGPE